MAEDETDTEALINKLNKLNAQQQKAAAEVADDLFKGVVVDKDTGDKVKAVNPNLTSSEETRYEKIFKILKDVISPGPEAGRSAAAARLDKEAQVAGMSGPGSLIATSKEKAASFIAALPILYEIFKENLATAFGALGNFFKGGLKKIFQTFGRRIVSIFKGVGTFIGKQFVRVGGFIKGMVTGLMKSPVGVRLTGAITGFFTGLTDRFTSIKTSVMKQATRLTMSLGIGTVAQATKAGAAGGGGAIMTAGANTGEKVVGGAAYRAIIEGTGRAVNPGFLGGLFNAGKSAFQAVTSPIASAKKQLGKLLGPRLRKIGGGILKRIPVLGTLIEAPFAAYDINKYAKNPELGEEQIKTAIGNRVIEGMAGIAGGALGLALASIGGPAGLLFGTLAYAGGDLLGRFLAEQFTNHVPMTALGDMVMNAFPSLTAAARAKQGTKVNDGIIYHGGQTVRINSKDDVLALKKGGPLDRMMQPNSMDIGSAQIFGDMKEFSRLQLETLIDIKNGIVALVQQSNNSLAGISSSSSKVSFKPNRLNADFNQSLAT